MRVKSGSILGLETSKGFLEVEWVINAAGLYADKIAEMAGLREYRIKPRKGEYMIFDKDAEPKVSKILFPTPTPMSKGVVVTTTPDGNLMLGPNAQDLPEDQRDDKSNTREGLDYVWITASKMVNHLPPKSKVIRYFAGLRPEPIEGDFIIKWYKEVFGFIDAAGTRSPGLTSAPAIAYKVLETIKSVTDTDFKLKKGWINRRNRIIRFSDLPLEKRSRLINKEPKYGRIICVDEMVTEMEVVEAIKRGATTIDGVKFRTRACMGLCQGSSCMYKIALILSKELGVPVWEVTIKGPGTEIGVGDVKTLFEADKVECENRQV